LHWDADFCAIKQLCSCTVCIKTKLSADSKVEQVKVHEFEGDNKSEGMKCVVCRMLLIDRFLSNVSQISVSCFIGNVNDQKRS
jgi:hypothetical protein